MNRKNRGKKRVRIQSGHEARYIENRNSRRGSRKNNKVTCKDISIDDDSRLCRNRTHRPTVSELVYLFLERASTQEVVSSQKRNAPKLLRKFERRKLLSRKPDASLPTLSNSLDWKSDEFFYKKLPFLQTEKRMMEKCLYEVLSFGTVLGFLEPADNEGLLFRVSSNLNIHKKKPKRQKSRSTGRETT